MFGFRKKKENTNDRDIWKSYYEVLANTYVGTNTAKDFYEIAMAVKEFERTMALWLVQDSKRVNVVFRDGMYVDIKETTLPKMSIRSNQYEDVRKKVLSMTDYRMVWDYIQKSLSEGWVEYTEGERWITLFVFINHAYVLAYERWFKC